MNTGLPKFKMERESKIYCFSPVQVVQISNKWFTRKNKTKLRGGRLHDNRVVKSHLYNILTKCPTQLILCPPDSSGEKLKNEKLEK